MQDQPLAAAYLTRDGILKLLSDEEVARVSTAETATRLSPGEQYVDLAHLDRGVRIATSTQDVPTSNLLARRAVRDDTWRKILAELAMPRARAAGDEYAVATYDSRTAAEEAIEALHHGGVDMTRLSIVGKDFRVKYEQDVRAGKFLVVAHGNGATIQRYRSILAAAVSQPEASAE